MASAQLSLLPQPEREVKPGGLEPVVFTVSNAGVTPLAITFVVDAAAGVSVLVPPSDLDLAAGASTLVAATVVLDATLAAGRYPIRLTAIAGAASASASANLKVLLAPGLRVTGPPTVSPGEFSVTVQNTGNQPDAVTVTARGAGGTLIAPSSTPTFQLAAGESRRLTYTTVIATPGAVFITASGASGAVGGVSAQTLPDASLPPPPFLWRGRLAAAGPPFGVGLSLAGPLSDFADSSFYVAWSPAVTTALASVSSGDFSVQAGFLSDSTGLTGVPVYGWGGRVVWSPAPWSVDVSATADVTTAAVSFDSTAARAGLSMQVGADGWSGQAVAGLNGNPNASTRFSWRPIAGLSWSGSGQYAPPVAGMVAALGLPAGSLSGASLAVNAAASSNSFSSQASLRLSTPAGQWQLDARLSVYSGSTSTSGGLSFQAETFGVSLNASLDADRPLVSASGSWAQALAPGVVLSGTAGTLLVGGDPLASLSASGTLTGPLFGLLSGNLRVSASRAGVNLGAGVSYPGQTSFSASGDLTWQAGLPVVTLGAAAGYNDGASNLSARGSLVVAGSSLQFAGQVSWAYTFSLPVPETLSEFAGGRDQGVVTGRVFVDLNGNGRADAGEPGAAGAVLKAGDFTGRADADGRFTLHLPSGVVNLSIATPELDAVPPAGVTLTLRAHDLVTLELAAAPAAHVRLRVTALLGPVPLALDGVGVTVSGAGGAFQLVSGPDGVAELSGLPAGDYLAAVTAAPSDATASLDVTHFSVRPGSVQTLSVTLEPPELTTDALAPEVSINPPDVTAPGAEPLVSVFVVGGADRVALLGADGAETILARLDGAHFAGRLVVPLDASGVVMARLRVTRGAQEDVQSFPLVVARLPLASVEFTPLVAAPRANVTVLARALFVAETLRLTGEGVDLPLVRDEADPTVWHGLLIVPADANGRTEFVLSGGSARVKVNLPAILVVKVGP